MFQYCTEQQLLDVIQKSSNSSRDIQPIDLLDIAKCVMAYNSVGAELYDMCILLYMPCIFSCMYLHDPTIFYISMSMFCDMKYCPVEALERAVPPMQ